MADLGEQIDSLSANKVKSEKDKVNTELDLRDAPLRPGGRCQEQG